jgi:signal peptidase I
MQVRSAPLLSRSSINAIHMGGRAWPHAHSAHRFGVEVAVLLLLISGWVLLLRPVWLGGASSYVMVSGHSMEPTLRNGDLVILRSAPNYEPGDVVAFHAKGGIAIHRIVGIRPDATFITQGDNNRVVDTWHPSPRDVLGRSWVRLPGFGELLGQLRDPVKLGALIGLIGFLAVMLPAKKSRRRVRPRS